MTFQLSWGLTWHGFPAADADQPWRVLRRFVADQMGYLSLWSLVVDGAWLAYWTTHASSDPVVRYGYALLVFPLSLFCAVGGSYITYVHPRALHLTTVGMTLTDEALLIVDAVGHWFPLLELWSVHDVAMDLPMTARLTSLLITPFALLVYWKCFDWRRRYGVGDADLLHIYGIWQVLTVLALLIH